jgi:A/G-specific adenine glycosylase
VGRIGFDGLREQLLEWYDRSRRDLPWRSTPGDRPDPYHVWLSEVMLQQTRVETVRPYYLRWLRRFPTLDALADASQEEVLREWEGLGYYARARNFHRAVREVSSVHGGEIPSDRERFLALPGVGRYTVGAVLSIAFGRPEPVVDGNVRRVFSRLLDDGAPSNETLWILASELVRGPRPGDFNQALMELGATVCTPRSPACAGCPVAGWCAARAAGTQASRPARKPSRAVPTENHGVAITRADGGALLLARRPQKGRLAGMWEFPGVSAREGEGLAEAAARAARDLAGVAVVPGESVGTVEHLFTHVRVVYHAFSCPVAPGASDPAVGEVAWVLPEHLAAYALPRAQRRLAGLLAGAAEPAGEGA